MHLVNLKQDLGLQRQTSLQPKVAVKSIEALVFATLSKT